jgi:tRNA-specific 2-thiouridylase
MDRTIQAIGLFSGGLDSLLALRLIQDQGLAVEAFHAILPVHSPALLRRVQQVTAEIGVPFCTVSPEQEFFEILRHPRHGYGAGMNPCLDCRILILRHAARHMREVGASFVFTGEVLGERPMSQTRQGLDLVESQAGLPGRLLRPLSARLLPPTIAEEEGLVDRGRLLAIEGRRRQPQLALARQYGIREFPPPAGGCLLTNRESARRVHDLLDHQPDFSPNDFYLLKVGRHFRLSPRARVVAGRDEAENARIVELAQAGDLLFEVPDLGSPVALLRGAADDESIHLAAAITARYSDARATQVLVRYGPVYPDLARTIAVERAPQELLERLRI